MVYLHSHLEKQEIGAFVLIEGFHHPNKPQATF